MRHNLLRPQARVSDPGSPDSKASLQAEFYKRLCYHQVPVTWVPHRKPLPVLPALIHLSICLFIHVYSFTHLLSALYVSDIREASVIEPDKNPALLAHGLMGMRASG